ncbi:hypothetical protein [Streptomyces sp. ICBB 8177]|uniref:hypothetical protein n=1 Tax=Streptomyces sp. ICBB 8177 TaxID=563922 RepID=UPI000D67BEBB|nr:hypothetical protein [Streptomyces sp. ICBB 8177]PWI42766.1 hypothetical protein CK485_10785 [Streptomyces sp. ICBB 8177]
MPIFGPRRGTPRLAPELDDAALGRVRKQLEAASSPGALSIRVDQVEQVLRDAGTDWDRRMHRLVVLARAADPAVAQSWRRRHPQQPDPVMFGAWVDLVRGRWQGALADPRALIDDCYRAADLAPDDPGPWVALLGALRTMARPLNEVLPIWREATARDPWNREAHLQMLGYLSPEECGSHVQVLDFVDSVRSAVPPDAPTAGVELIALVERHLRTVSSGGLNALMATRQWAQPQVAAALDQALTDWLKPGFLTHAAAIADLNLLAYALVQANRGLDAAQVFQAIGGLVTPWPWGLDGDPVRQFTYWQGRTQR